MPLGDLPALNFQIIQGTDRCHTAKLLPCADRSETLLKSSYISSAIATSGDVRYRWKGW